MNHCLKICQYQRNVPQHYYLLDTLVIRINVTFLKLNLCLVTKIILACIFLLPQLWAVGFFSNSNAFKYMCEQGCQSPTALRCLNGGSCVAVDKKKKTFSCLCKAPWSGKNCEIKPGKKMFQEFQCFKNCNEFIFGHHFLSNDLHI